MNHKELLTRLDSVIETLTFDSHQIDKMTDAHKEVVRFCFGIQNPPPLVVSLAHSVMVGLMSCVIGQKFPHFARDARNRAIRECRTLRDWVVQQQAVEPPSVVVQQPQPTEDPKPQPRFGVYKPNNTPQRRPGPGLEID